MRHKTREKFHRNKVITNRRGQFCSGRSLKSSFKVWAAREKEYKKNSSHFNALPLESFDDLCCEFSVQLLLLRKTSKLTIFCIADKFLLSLAFSILTCFAKCYFWVQCGDQFIIISYFFFKLLLFSSEKYLHSHFVNKRLQCLFYVIDFVRLFEFEIVNATNILNTGFHRKLLAFPGSFLANYLISSIVMRFSTGNCKWSLKNFCRFLMDMMIYHTRFLKSFWWFF